MGNFSSRHALLGGTLALAAAKHMHSRRRDNTPDGCRDKTQTQKDFNALDPKLLSLLGRQKMWELLLPKSLRSQGAWELLLIMAINIYRVFLNLRLVHLVKAGDAVIFNRNATAYWANQLDMVRYALQSIVLGAITRYTKQRLCLQWKERLTKVLYEKYFADTNFYFIENEIQDADVRMTQEVDNLTNGFADFVNAGLLNMSTGIFYVCKLWYEYGILYAVTPAVYIAAAHVLAGKIAPLDLKIFGEQAAFQGMYRSAHTRLVAHAEAITALRGGAREQSILSNVFNGMVSVQRRVHSALFPYSTAVEFLVHRLMWTGCAWAVIGRGTFDPMGPGTLESITATRAEVGYQFILYVQVIQSATLGSTAYTEYNKLGGEAGRIYELLERLDRISDRQVEASQTGDAIAFSHVDIETPKGNLLVKDLSFEVTSNNDSLLLTGHNGAGKSSIFRCLAGLWKIKTGTIIKPHGNDLTKDVFYLPQKPYNIIGTLVHQLTYPEASSQSQHVTEARVRNILGKVELEYLADQYALSDEINWNETLSLGEKQRLAIARVIYHKPRFAILDECTSGVSQAMETQLYLLLNEQQISYITISHRPMLEALHCKTLCIHGDTEKSYTYKTLRTPQELRAGLLSGIKDKQPMGHSASDLAEQASCLVQRSQRYKHIAQQQTQRQITTQTTFKQNNSPIASLRNILSGALPVGWKPATSIVLGGIVLKAILSDASLFLVGNLFRALFKRDRKLLYRTAAMQVVVAFCESLCNQYTALKQKQLQVDLQETISKKYMDKYMKKYGFYCLKNDGRITDPEARLSDDLGQLVQSLSTLTIDIISPIFMVLWLGKRLMVSINSLDAAGLYAYLFLAGLVARRVMPDFKSLAAEQSAVDAKLRFTHSTVRFHAESIAFFGGGKREKALIQERFENTLTVRRKKIFADVFFEVFKRAFVGSVPERLQQHLRFRYANQYFSDDSKIIADGGADLAQGQHLIWQIQENVKINITAIIEVSDKLDSLSGIISRLDELDLALDEQQPPPFTVLSAKAAGGGLRPSLRIEGLDIVTPKGECLASNVNLQVDSHQRLLVTGPNASGKTSFFRLLGGLWPIQPCEAKIDYGGAKVFLVPQRVYSVSGTLLDQVTYPDYEDKNLLSEAVLHQVEVKALQLLELVGVGYLAERIGWHAVGKFEDELSLGEQQRIGMARLFYHQPDFAVLDECTDAVSVDVEEKLYKAAEEMGIVCITISKRLALVDRHEQELRLGENTEAGCVIGPVQ